VPIEHPLEELQNPVDIPASPHRIGANMKRAFPSASGPFGGRHAPAVMEFWNDAAKECLPNNPRIQHSITPFPTAPPAYTVALGIPPRRDIEGAEDTCLRREGKGYGRQATDLTASKPTLSGADPARRDGAVQLDFDKSISDGVNMNPESFRGYAKRDGDADFVFLARDTASPYIDNRPLLVATKPELREYKAVYVQSDAEIGLFSDEVVVNCAP